MSTTALERRWRQVDILRLMCSPPAWSGAAPLTEYGMFTTPWSLGAEPRRWRRSNTIAGTVVPFPYGKGTHQTGSNTSLVYLCSPRQISSTTLDTIRCRQCPAPNSKISGYTIYEISCTEWPAAKLEHSMTACSFRPDWPAVISHEKNKQTNKLDPPSCAVCFHFFFDKLLKTII